MADKSIDKPLARELALTIENDGLLYRQMYEPIAKNYSKKKAACIYDQAKALKGVVNLVEEGLRRYKKETGMIGSVNMATKLEAARELLPGIEDLANDFWKEKCKTKPKSCKCLPPK